MAPTPGVSDHKCYIMTRNSYTMGAKIGEGHFGLVFSAVDVRWVTTLR